MAGKLCPECSRQTFFKTTTGRECSKCGYTMTLLLNEGKGGKGRLCSNCGRFKVFNDVCTDCGAKYSRTQ